MRLITTFAGVLLALTSAACATRGAAYKTSGGGEAGSVDGPTSSGQNPVKRSFGTFRR